MSLLPTAVLQAQRALKRLHDGQKVYRVIVTCDGEHSVHAIYASREHAVKERDAYNAGNHRGHYDKASIEQWPYDADPAGIDDMLEAYKEYVDPIDWSPCRWWLWGYAFGLFTASAVIWIFM